MSKIFTVVRNIVAERSGITPKSLEGCTNLEAVGLDGMDMSELIMAIEDEFDIEISDDEYNAIGTLDDIVELVKKKEKKKS
ncbi:MAG: acyl carrier protein [Bacteroidetes bacterium]|uniref:Acyl carrier protein n=1 Tax=Candidatus Merdivivens pullistercoris TaxID=2840873 RepID=A0A9D9I4R8_9BACT|nr:acyl carrier protein [Candidatus Merdivivens pullistercoris]